MLASTLSNPDAGSLHPSGSTLPAIFSLWLSGIADIKRYRQYFV